MAKPPTPILTCGQCGYENEPERVYCHNCGTKLDRSVLPKEKTTQEENLAATKKRIKKMTNPGRGFQDVKTAFNTILLAAMVAAIYLLVMPPEQLPSKEKEANAQLISVPIDYALENPAPSTLQFTEADISGHLRSRVKGAEVIPGLDFKRAYAVINDGKITLGVYQDLAGLALYSTIEYEVGVKDDVFYAKKVGQHFGRLGIDPRIPWLDDLFTPIWAKQKRERQVLERAHAIAFTKDTVTIILKPASAVAPPR